MLKPGDSLGRLRKALCYLCACLVLRWQLTGGAWPWAGPLQSFLMALLGLQFPAVAHFGVICSSNPTASAFQSSSGGREQPGEGTLLGR